jgi:hypothetical protein
VLSDEGGKRWPLVEGAERGEERMGRRLEGGRGSEERDHQEIAHELQEDGEDDQADVLGCSRREGQRSGEEFADAAGRDGGEQ